MSDEDGGECEVAEDEDQIIEKTRRSLASKAFYRKALICYRRSVRFKNEGREVLARPQLVRSQRLLQYALWELPENRPAHFLLAAVMMQLGSFANAKRELMLLLKCVSVDRTWQDKKDPVLHQAIAHASWRLEQDGEAMTHLLEATNDFPDHPQLCLVLSELLLAAKCSTSAKDMAKLALLRNDSTWCKQHLSASEKERATCCLNVALQQLGSSLDDASMRSQPLNLTPMSDRELQQRSQAFMTRLRTRAKATDLSRRAVSAEAKVFEFRHESGKAARSDAVAPQSSKDPRQADTMSTGSTLLMRDEAAPASSNPTRNQRLEWSQDKKLAEPKQNLAEPPTISSPSHSGHSPSNNSPARAEFGPSLEKPPSSTPSSKPRQNLKDVMMGLLPLDRPKMQNSSGVPAVEAAITPQMGLWCCATDCKKTVYA